MRKLCHFVGCQSGCMTIAMAVKNGECAVIRHAGVIRDAKAWMPPVMKPYISSVTRMSLGD